MSKSRFGIPVTYRPMAPFRIFGPATDNRKYCLVPNGAGDYAPLKHGHVMVLLASSVIGSPQRCLPFSVS